MLIDSYSPSTLHLCLISQRFNFLEQKVVFTRLYIISYLLNFSGFSLSSIFLLVTNLPQSDHVTVPFVCPKDFRTILKVERSKATSPTKGVIVQSRYRTRTVSPSWKGGDVRVVIVSTFCVIHESLMNFSRQ